MTIPRTFQLMGQTVNVCFDDGRCHRNDCIGMADLQEGTIFLAQKKKDGTRISDDVVGQTLFHEIVHLIYESLGVCGEATIDEKHITQVSGLLHQAIKTFKP